MWGKEEGEGAFDHGVVEERAVRAVITRLERRVFVTTDIEDVEQALRPVHVSGEGHDPSKLVSVKMYSISVSGPWDI